MRRTLQEILYNLLSATLNRIASINKVKTGLGTLLGFAIYGVLWIILSLAGSSLVSSPYVCFACIALGVLLPNIKMLFSKYRIDEELETKMYYLREIQQNGGFSQREKQKQWRELAEQVYQRDQKSNNNTTSDETNHK